MQAIQNGYVGLSLLVNLNWDRLFYFGAIAAGLAVGAFAGTLLGH